MKTLLRQLDAANDSAKNRHACSRVHIRHIAVDVTLAPGQTAVKELSTLIVVNYFERDTKEALTGQT